MLLSILCIASLFFVQQNNTGALKGTVTDQLGSLVVGAKVTVRNARGVVTSATTNSAGVYEFRRLEPGTYELKIVSPGFSTFEEKEVEITARELKTLLPNYALTQLPDSVIAATRASAAGAASGARGRSGRRGRRPAVRDAVPVCGR